MGTVRKPLAVFHGFHNRSEGEKGEVAFSLRRLAAALLPSLFSLILKRKGECFQRVIHFSVPFVTLKGKHPRKSACPYVIGDRQYRPLRQNKHRLTLQKPPHKSMVVKSEKLFSDLHTHYTESRSTVQCTRCSESQRFFRIGAIPSVSVKQNRVCYEQCLIAACQNRLEAGFTVPKYLMHIFFRTSRQRSDHQLSNPLHLELPSFLFAKPQNVYTWNI